jgi:hypothetical protein
MMLDNYDDETRTVARLTINPGRSPFGRKRHYSEIRMLDRLVSADSGQLDSGALGLDRQLKDLLQPREMAFRVRKRQSLFFPIMFTT